MAGDKGEEKNINSCSYLFLPDGKMQIERTISRKGQIVIPKDVRDYLGLKSGSEIVFEVKGREVVLRPKASAKKFVEEFTNVKGKLKKLDIKRLKNILEMEYELH